MVKDDHELRHAEVLDNREHVDNDCTQTLNFNIEQIFNHLVKYFTLWQGYA